MLVNCVITSSTKLTGNRTVYSSVKLPIFNLPKVGDEIDISIVHTKIDFDDFPNEIFDRAETLYNEVSGVYYWIESNEIYKVRIETIPRNPIKD